MKRNTLLVVLSIILGIVAGLFIGKAVSDSNNYKDTAHRLLFCEFENIEILDENGQINTTKNIPFLFNASFGALPLKRSPKGIGIILYRITCRDGNGTPVTILIGESGISVNGESYSTFRSVEFKAVLDYFYNTITAPIYDPME